VPRLQVAMARRRSPLLDWLRRAQRARGVEVGLRCRAASAARLARRRGAARRAAHPGSGRGDELPHHRRTGEQQPADVNANPDHRWLTLSVNCRHPGRRGARLSRPASPGNREAGAAKPPRRVVVGPVHGQRSAGISRQARLRSWTRQLGWLRVPGDGLRHPRAGHVAHSWNDRVEHHHGEPDGRRAAGNHRNLLAPRLSAPARQRRSGVASFTMRSALPAALPVLQNEVGPIAVGYQDYSAPTLPTGMAPLTSGTIHASGLTASGTVASVLTTDLDCTLHAIGVASQMAGETVTVNLYSQWGGSPDGAILATIADAPLRVGYVELPLSAGVFLPAGGQVVVELVYSDPAAAPIVIGPDVINVTETSSTSIRPGRSADTHRPGVRRPADEPGDAWHRVAAAHRFRVPDRSPACVTPRAAPRAPRPARPPRGTRASMRARRPRARPPRRRCSPPPVRA